MEGLSEGPLTKLKRNYTSLESKKIVKGHIQKALSINTFLV